VVNGGENKHQSIIKSIKIKIKTAASKKWRAGGWAKISSVIKRKMASKNERPRRMTSAKVKDGRKGPQTAGVTATTRHTAYRQRQRSIA